MNEIKKYYWFLILMTVFTLCMIPSCSSNKIIVVDNKVVDSELYRVLRLPYGDGSGFIPLIVPKRFPDFTDRDKYQRTKNYLSPKLMVLRADCNGDEFLRYEILVETSQPLAYILVEVRGHGEEVSKGYWKYIGGVGLPKYQLMKQEHYL